jgi:hypothetical protein
MRFLSMLGLAALALASSAQADWQNIINCNNGAAGVDIDTSQGSPVYQLVVRDPNAVNRFLNLTQLRLPNSNGELILRMQPMQSAPGTRAYFTFRPIYQSANGYTGNVNAILSPQGLSVNLIEYGPSGPGRQEIWNFGQCQSR